MKMLSNHILIEVLTEEEKQVSGVYIPDNAQEKPTRGKVLAVGPGMFDHGLFIEMDVKIGDIVLFASWAGSFNEVKIPNEDRKVATIKQSDIIAIL